MSAKTKSTTQTETEQVKEWMSKLDAELRPAINAVRKIIKMAGPELNERIKWNAPSYYYKPARRNDFSHSGGEDIVTFGPARSKDKIILVFHHPDIIKIKSGLLQGNYKDRRLVYLNSLKDVKEAKKELERIIKESVQLLDK
ncbi:MAG TPA: DUF1801 domain-containing protein [Chitinophagaceae bacterium]|nr:DUF1801 domain-containing protein [Chitinophagaceae bacterium]